MYYTKHLPDKKVRRCRRSVIILTVVLTFFAINAGLHPIIEGMLIIQARMHFNAMVNRAVERVISEGGAAGGFVLLTEAEDGMVTSVQTDTAAINAFRARLGQALSEELDMLDEEPVLVSIGTLTGIDLLTGRGPDVKLRLVQNGSIITELVSSFTASGINQTCHTISCIVDAQFYAVIPGFRTPVSMQADIIVAQSVIVGNVPDSYTSVYGDQSDTIGRIFDYGDPYGEDVSE